MGTKYFVGVNDETLKAGRLGNTEWLSNTKGSSNTCGLGNTRGVSNTKGSSNTKAKYSSFVGR